MTTTAGTPTPSPPLGRRFLTVWFGQSVSTLGTFVSGIGVAVYVFTRTDSVIWLGVLSATFGVSVLVAAPFIGLLDRYERRSIMIFADAFAAAGTVAALALALAGELEVWHLVVVSFIGGIGNAFQVPASMAALPILAGDALDRANGLLQLGPAIGLVIGPAIGAALIGAFGITAVLWFDLGTFLIAIVTTTVTPFRMDSDASAADRSGWRAAIAWLRSDGRPFVTLIVMMTAVNLFMGVFNVAMLALATDLGGASRAGLVPSVGGLGMIVASAVMAVRGLPDHRMAVFRSGLVVLAAGLLVAAARPSFVLVIIGVALGLVTIPVVNAAVSTTFNERVPEELQGRVFGIRLTLGRALDPVGSLAAGLGIGLLAAPAMESDGALAGSLGRLIGTGEDRGSALMLIVVAIGLLAIVLVARTNQRLRSLDEQPVAEDASDAPVAA